MLISISSLHCMSTYAYFERIQVGAGFRSICCQSLDLLDFLFRRLLNSFRHYGGLLFTSVVPVFKLVGKVVELEMQFGLRFSKMFVYKVTSHLRLNNQEIFPLPGNVGVANSPLKTKSWTIRYTESILKSLTHYDGNTT